MLSARSNLRRASESPSVRHDAWRTQLFHEQIAEEMAARRRAAAMRAAIAAGVVIGVVGSALLNL